MNIEGGSVAIGFCLELSFAWFQEARLILVPSKECNNLQSEDMKFFPKKELCGANKISRKIDAYKYHEGRSLPPPSENCPYCPDFQRVTHFLDKDVKYGQIDSCTGDSGGPLWKWIGKKDPRARVLCLLF